MVAKIWISTKRFSLARCISSLQCKNLNCCDNLDFDQKVFSGEMYFIFAMQKLKWLRQFGFRPKGSLWRDGSQRSSVHPCYIGQPRHSTPKDSDVKIFIRRYVWYARLLSWRVPRSWRQNPAWYPSAKFLPPKSCSCSSQHPPTASQSGGWKCWPLMDLQSGGYKIPVD